MSGGRAKTPNSHTAALREVELNCHRLAQENAILRTDIALLLAQVPNPMPDGLDQNRCPNLFSFMGSARLARVECCHLRASSQSRMTFEQGTSFPTPGPTLPPTLLTSLSSGALLQELETILMQGEPVSATFRV
jgi:hypothetical protein